jgi:hypothetical protein
VQENHRSAVIGLHFSKVRHQLVAILRFVKMQDDELSNLTRRAALKNVA